MRKKQLFAVLLAGALTVGIAPTSAFAAEATSTLAIEEPAQMGTEATPLSETETGGETTPATEVTPEAPVEEPVQEPTEAPVETPTETPVQTPVETPTETPSQTPSNGNQTEQNDQAAQTQDAEETTPTPTPGEKEGAGTVILGEKTYPTLNAAVNDATGTADAPAEIIVSGDIELSETVSVSIGKYIIIASATNDTTIKRADGFTGEMFKLDGGSLQMSLGTLDQEESTDSASLTVDGTLTDEEAMAADGPIVSVASGNFVLCDGVTLTGNVIDGNGGAIANAAGTVALYGGVITENQATNGGAVYSEGIVSVKGAVSISGNTKYGDVAENNIVLKGDSAAVSVAGAITGTGIGVQFLEGTEGKQIITLAEGVTDTTLAEAVTAFTYEGDGFTIGEDGTLKSTAVTTPTPTPVPLKLEGKSVNWIDATSAKVVCVANKDGWYYADWVVKGEEPPTFDLEKEGVPVKANQEFTIYFNNLDSEHSIDIYVRVKDKDNNVSKKMLFRLDGEARPTPNPTPAGRDPIIPAVTDSTVTGLEEPLAFYPNTFYPFTVTGAGSNNTDPIQGDVKWVPLYWAMSSNPSDSNKNSTWKIGAAAGITQAGTYNIYIFFQKYEFNGSEWVATDVIESASYKFSSKAITITATPTTYSGQQGSSGDGTVYGESATTYDSTDGSVTGTSSTADTVSTADESPIGTMSMLAVASLLAGGYVLVRKRKKEI